jgi:hypothetical protein
MRDKALRPASVLADPKPSRLPPILASAERHADRQANCQQLAFAVHLRLSAQRGFFAV